MNTTAENVKTKYYQNEQLHRLDGPAVMWSNTGDQMWYAYGELHRIDGPAVILGEHCEWHLYGRRVTQLRHFVNWLLVKLRIRHC